MIDWNTLTERQLANLFDHTQLKAFADASAFETLCSEAREYGFKMVAINPAQVVRCKELLAGTPVHVGAAVSFPLGQTTIADKVRETKTAIANGADEIDYVINISELKNGNLAYIEEEMTEIVAVCREGRVISKVIFETCYLTEEEIVAVAQIARRVRPDFVKTSTGFGTAGATAEHVALMKQTVGDGVKVKAAGGIRDWDTCRAMLEAGAERIGTSASIKILREFRAARKEKQPQ